MYHVLSWGLQVNIKIFYNNLHLSDKCLINNCWSIYVCKHVHMYVACLDVP